MRFQSWGRRDRVRARCSISSSALEPPDIGPGEVILDGRNPFTLSDKDLSAFRNKEVGFVFQDHCLLPQLNVVEKCSGAADGGASRCLRRRIAKALLDQVGLAHQLRSSVRASFRAARSSVWRLLVR